MLGISPVLVPITGTATLRCADAALPVVGAVSNGCECSPTSAGDDANPGTRDLPVATIYAAMWLTSKDKPNMYVAQGSQAESCIVKNESLYGGFNGDFSQRDSQKFVTTIVGVASGFDGATVRGDDAYAPIVLDGFTILGPPLTSHGRVVRWS